jgi:hypothetical protein
MYILWKLKKKKEQVLIQKLLVKKHCVRNKKFTQTEVKKVFQTLGPDWPTLIKIKNKKLFLHTENPPSIWKVGFIAILSKCGNVGKTYIMRKGATSKKGDIIMLNGYPDFKIEELKIDLVAQELKKFFDDYEYISRVEFSRRPGKSIDEVMKEFNKKKFILNCTTKTRFLSSYFTVLFIGSKTNEKRYFLIEEMYDYVVDIDVLSIEDIAKEIIVAWGCWVDDRPVTKPI